LSISCATIKFLAIFCLVHQIKVLHITPLIAALVFQASQAPISAQAVKLCPIQELKGDEFGVFSCAQDICHQEPLHPGQGFIGWGQKQIYDYGPRFFMITLFDPTDLDQEVADLVENHYKNLATMLEKRAKKKHLANHAQKPPQSK
jgi:hypothetical protein